MSDERMDLVAPKKALMRLLQRCQGVAQKKNTMPILTNVLLDADDGQLTAYATDLYISVCGTIEAEVAHAGSIALPARDLLERAKHMTDGPVGITVESGSSVTIKAIGGNRRYTLHSLPGSDFPQMPEPGEDSRSMDLTVETLATLMQHIRFAISTDESRPHMNGALLECADGLIRMVSTDGQRLCKIEIPIDGLPDTSILLPLKGVIELSKLLDEVTDKSSAVAVTQTDPNVFFQLHGVEFAIKTVPDQFPPYENVIPSPTEHAVTVSRQQLCDALKAVAVSANDVTAGVKIEVMGNRMKITSESPGSGAGFDELTVSYAGPNVAVGFNADYLIDALGVIDGDDVTLQIGKPLDPAVIQPVSELDYVAVVMPMRI